MKKLLLLTLSLLVAVSFAFIQDNDKCSQKTLSTKCKEQLKPYNYDSAKLTKVNFGKKAQKLSIEVPVFIGEKYRLVFNTSGLSKKIGINVYNKDKDAKKRDLLYSNKDIDPSKTDLVFDAPRLRKMFIDYDIPSDSLSAQEKGCVMMMVGYK